MAGLHIAPVLSDSALFDVLVTGAGKAGLSRRWKWRHQRGLPLHLNSQHNSQRGSRHPQPFAGGEAAGRRSVPWRLFSGLP